MWKCSALLILVCLCVPISALPEPPASLSPEQELLPSTSPLAQLLASASGIRSSGFSPLAPPAPIRNKKKHFSFKSKGESRFRPKSFKKKTHKTFGKPKGLKVEEVQDVKPRFSSFLKRPKPVTLAQEQTDYKSGNEEIITPTVQTTSKPLQLTDFFGTPEPVQGQNRPLATAGPRLHTPIVLGISNDISSDAFSDQRALFERLQSMTGAQAIGITRDTAVDRENTVGAKAVVKEKKGAVRGETDTELVETKESSESEQVTSGGERKGQQIRQKKGRRRGRVGGRRKIVDLVRKKEEEGNMESAERQGKELSFVKAPLPPKRKKANFVRKKRNKAKVVTVDRYRNKNDDGSITWGYSNDDGAFKEETIGMDCITHGKYGFTDSNGEKREYSYSSGVRCDPDSRKVAHTDPAPPGHGFYDYSENKFVMPSGRRVTVVVNQRNKARGRRY